MRTKYFFLLFFLTAVLLFPMQEIQYTEDDPATQVTQSKAKTVDKDGKPVTKVKKPMKFEIDLAYVYREESLVISETDLRCTHFITNDQIGDISIIGSEMMVWDRIDYADNDFMYINKGSANGIRETDVFLVLGKGSKITNPITGKSLGTFYLKKSLAEVYCLYEDKAIIKLNKGCQPVQIGDTLIPYKPVEPLFKNKLDYRLCRLPQGAVEGHVVYTNIYTNFSRDLSSDGQYVTVDVGNSMVSVGDWLIFYIQFNKELPPFIAGFGIIIDSQKTCSTVKVMESSHQVEVGMPIVMMPAEKGGPTPLATTGQEERLPTLGGLKNADGTPVSDRLSIDVIFDIDDIIIKEDIKPELEKITAYIADKSEYIIILRGYACSIGGLEYNLKLSQNRVNNIKKYLMETFNIKEEFIESYFYGEKDPVYDNSSETERRKNRRVNIEVQAR